MDWYPEDCPNKADNTSWRPVANAHWTRGIGSNKGTLDFLLSPPQGEEYSAPPLILRQKKKRKSPDNIYKYPHTPSNNLNDERRKE